MVQCDKVCDVMASKSLGETVQTVLSLAKRAHRITLGFPDAIKLLSKTPEEAQFCFLAEPKRGDSATHMNEVLLQAFCYEHGIYIIKVDDGRKLAHILDTLLTEVSCVLIRKCNLSGNSVSDEQTMTTTTAATATTMMKTTTTTAKITNTFNTSAITNSFPSTEEDLLINFCETSWHNTDYDIIKLPES